MHPQNLMNSLWDIRIFLGLVPKESHCTRLYTTYEESPIPPHPLKQQIGKEQNYMFSTDWFVQKARAVFAWSSWLNDRKQMVHTSEAVTVHIGTENEWLAAAPTDGAEFTRYQFINHSDPDALHESLCRILLVRQCIKMKHESSLSTNYVTG